jgi:hypothetical protein
VVEAASELHDSQDASVSGLDRHQRFGRTEVALRLDFCVWKGFGHFVPIEQTIIGHRSLEPEAIRNLINLSCSRLGGRTMMGQRSKRRNDGS